MRNVAATAVALMLLPLSGGPAGFQRQTDSFMPVGVSYHAGRSAATDAAQTRDAWRRDLLTIKSLGFNSVWTSIEPAGTGTDGQALKLLGSIAEEAGLYVVADGTGVEGTAVYPQPAAPAPALSPVLLMARLDAARSAGRARGWVAELQAGRAAAGGPDVTGAALRLWGWAAISRGARAIRFSAWHPGAAGYGMVAPDGAVTERAWAAGEFAGVIARNGSLFAPLRPRDSRVAIVSMLLADRSTDALYRALFERNIQVDFLNPIAMVAGEGSKYRALCVADSSKLPRLAADALEGFRRRGGTIIDGAPSDMVQRLAVAGVTPDIRIDGAPGLVEARFLESAGAILLIAINHAETPQRVTFSFDADIPEAIWQDMETGAAVHFVQQPSGPSYTRSFAARDVMVLVRGKRLR